MPVKILIGDVMDRLATLPDQSVNCIVTSPPYYGVRDYGAAGQIGLEETPTAYVERITAVFSEARRVLRDDGTCWINLGDSYAGSWGAQGHRETPETISRNRIANHPKRASKTSAIREVGLKPKDLIGIPWRVAFALQADGWYLRSDIVWAKPNGMPESVRDRPTRAHEYVFLLTKSARYFYDGEALRLPAAPSSVARLAQRVDEQIGSARANGGGKTNGAMKAVSRSTDKQRGHSRWPAGFNDRWDQMERDEQLSGGAAARDVWWIAPAQSRDAHFAVMPETLAAACILAGCPPGGTVLDPFGGSGTTGAVAQRLGRTATLIELNPAYAEIAEQRIAAEPLGMAV